MWNYATVAYSEILPRQMLLSTEERDEKCTQFRNFFAP
jgi:hypothetical protein